MTAVELAVLALSVAVVGALVVAALGRLRDQVPPTARLAELFDPTLPARGPYPAEQNDEGAVWVDDRD